MANPREEVARALDFEKRSTCLRQSCGSAEGRRLHVEDVVDVTSFHTDPATQLRLLMPLIKGDGERPYPNGRIG